MQDVVEDGAGVAGGARGHITNALGEAFCRRWCSEAVEGGVGLQKVID